MLSLASQANFDGKTALGGWIYDSMVTNIQWNYMNLIVFESEHRKIQT